MALKTLYTAIGRFERRQNGCGRSCPVIIREEKNTWLTCRKWLSGPA